MGVPRARTGSGCAFEAAQASADRAVVKAEGGGDLAEGVVVLAVGQGDRFFGARAGTPGSGLALSVSLSRGRDRWSELRCCVRVVGGGG